MITKFKIFEKLNEGEPKRGDYVICHNPYYTMDKNHELMSTIAKIIDVSYVSGKPLYRVEFEKEIKLPNYSYLITTSNFWLSEIKYWSSKREDLLQYTEYYDDISKYNL